MAVVLLPSEIKDANIDMRAEESSTSMLTTQGTLPNRHMDPTNLINLIFIGMSLERTVVQALDADLCETYKSLDDSSVVLATFNSPKKHNHLLRILLMWKR